MSKSDSSVSWRLNELISAGRKAKAFASAEWSQPDEGETNPEFQLWTPKVLDSLGGAEEELSADEPIEETASAEQAASAEENAEPVVEDIEPAVPSFDQLALDVARRESFEEGYQKAMTEAEGKWASARDDFIAFTDTLRSAQSSDNDFYQPLKKLALHLAEQLVRGELTQSTAVIERLLEEAIKDIEQQGEGPIVVSLSAADHRQFTAHLSSELENLTLRIDPKLSQGSVKITMDDSAVEDLIETRLSALSEKLLGLPEHQSAPKSTLKQRQAMSRSATGGEFDSPVINSPVINSPVIDDAVIDGTVIDSSDIDGAVDYDRVVDEGSLDKSTVNESTVNESTANKSADDSPIDATDPANDDETPDA